MSSSTIKDMIPAEDKEKILGWNTITLDFKEGNPILGYPTPDNQMCMFIYNKKIMQEVGLDWEADPPRTMERFFADMEKIKNAGYIPIGADEAIDGYAYYFFQIAAYWWVQQNGFDPILAADRGEGNFADDQALLTALASLPGDLVQGLHEPGCRYLQRFMAEVPAGQGRHDPTGQLLRQRRPGCVG